MSSISLTGSVNMFETEINTGRLLKRTIDKV
jgi:hypothetical protein